MSLFYNFGIFLYGNILKVAALWNPKARLWIDGRKNWKKQLPHKDLFQGKRVLWMHCASLGEFEQGRPVLEALKKKETHAYIVLTFFSPSGFEARKNYSGADFIGYLPLDTKLNASYWIHHFKPSLCIFVKYEFWNHFIFEAKKNKGILILLAATFRKSQPFFKWYGGYYQKALSQFNLIFTQDKKSQDLIQNLLPKIQVITTGDPRYDRCLDLAKKVQVHPDLIAFKSTKKLLVVGSSWAVEEKMIQQLPALADWKILIVPHEITRGKTVLHMFPNAVLWSANRVELEPSNMLILDAIGYLFGAYSIADLTFVGGGFTGALHNIIEPASLGKMVLMGPNHSKFIEADQLIQAQGGAEVQNTDDLLYWIQNEVLIAQNGVNASVFCSNNAGSTEQSIREIEKLEILN